jgi:NACHT NTPase-like protein
MAEALVCISTASSIADLVKLCSKVVRRIKDYRDVPRTFRQIQVQLPVLRNILQNTDSAINAGYFDEDVVLPVVGECAKQIEALGTLLEKSLPGENDSHVKRGRKAINSILKDSKIESITDSIQTYIQTLTANATASLTQKQGLKGMILSYGVTRHLTDRNPTKRLRNQFRKVSETVSSTRPSPKS